VFIIASGSRNLPNDSSRDERAAQHGAEIRLAHCQHHPAHAHPAADVLVDRIWGLLAARKLTKALDGKDYIETVWGRGYVLREPSEDEARISA
jgi:DNA-binding response OmpR family regulator